MPLKVVAPSRKLPVRRIVSIVTLAVAVGVLVLVLHKPKPVAPPRTHEALAAGVQSLQTKVRQLSAPIAADQPAEPVHLTADEIAAAMAQAAGTLPAAGASANTPTGDAANTIAAMDGVPTPSEPIVTFDGDQLQGQFVSEVAGKKVYVTVKGHLGAKDGYATFEPTEFKVGDLNVPVSLVNDALQKRMMEQHDKLKLPDSVSDVHVENGELVVTRK